MALFLPTTHKNPRRFDKKGNSAQSHPYEKINIFYQITGEDQL
jgi:hypothetical protein